MLVPTSIRRLPALQWRRRDMEEARRVAARWRARPRAHVLVFPLESAAFSGALSQRTDRAGLAHSKMVPAGVGLPAYRNGAECTELGGVEVALVLIISARAPDVGHAMLRTLVGADALECQPGGPRFTGSLGCRLVGASWYRFFLRQ